VIKPYNELVGILATFSKPARTYRVSYVYRYKRGDDWGEVCKQYGMDFVLCTPIRVVENGISDTYAPTIHGIWRAPHKAYNQVFWQFAANQTPDSLALAGSWKLWAE